jgi:hypothetical protein
MLIEIRTHDGLVIQEEVESYDENVVANQLNGGENNVSMVVFGKTVLNRHNVKMVRPVEVAPEPAI